MRIAVVGTGVSGLVCAHLLGRDHDLTIYEADTRPGGHTNTVRVDLPEETHHVDTGFIVFNERTYPAFTRLLERLDVASHESDMSFSVADEAADIEWCGTSARTVFAQPRNLARPSFHRMLADVVRFNRTARRLLDAGDDPDVTLADLLSTGKWSRGFVDRYLVPLGSAIWSADPQTFLRFPATTFARFFDNHGLLELGGRPQWRTVTGGAARYVDKVLEPLQDRLRLASPIEKITRREAGVEVLAAGAAPETFDHVIVAAHSDQALELLSDPTDAEREILGAIAYQPNVATLHTDRRMLPRRRAAWASWNYHRLADATDRSTVTYHLNRLQGLRSAHQLCVTLNRPDAIDPDSVLATFDYSHPVFDAAAVRAQRRAAEINGVRGTWYCGAYWGYGFHEDGVQSALRVCELLGARL